MGPKIAAQQVVEGTDLALPGGDIHDGIDGDAHHFSVLRQQLLALHLVANHLPRAHVFPVGGIKRKYQVAPSALVTQMKPLFYASHEHREIKIGSDVGKRQQTAVHLPGILEFPDLGGEWKIILLSRKKEGASAAPSLPYLNGMLAACTLVPDDARNSGRFSSRLYGSVRTD